MSWNVEDKSVILLYHPKTSTFAGKPHPFLNNTSPTNNLLGMSLTSDPKEIQPITLTKVTPSPSPITTDTMFIFNVYVEGKGNLAFHAPLVNAKEISDNPPIPISLRKGETLESNHIQFIFLPASKEQQSLNDKILHYGMPVYFTKRNERRYLTVDSYFNMISVLRVPVSIDEMDPWVIIPTFTIASCINPKTKQCHVLSGVDVNRAMMHCEYTDKTKGGGIQCFDDVGHEIFKGIESCREKCKVPSFMCSGPPLFQCTPQYDNDNEWISFDQCTEKCINPVLQQSIAALVPLPPTIEPRASGETPASPPPPSKGTLPVLAIVAGIISVCLIILLWKAIYNVNRVSQFAINMSRK